jgi:DNA polymerase-3 subunit delta'
MYTVLGQDRAIGTIQHAIDVERSHHAWIFAGPRGVGKCSTAIYFAQQILETSKKPSEHPDLHIVRKEDVAWSQNTSLQKKKQTNIPLDLLRERIIGGKTSDDKMHDAVVFKTPAFGKNKVFIIDEAELLDVAGQNALLKTLEEPPVGTTIILVTSRDDLLLPTIHSRCNLVSFAPLSQQAMLSWSENANLDVSPSDLSWLLSFSNGSPGLVCDAIDAGLPGLASDLELFLSLKNTNYAVVVQKIVSFAESFVAKKIKQNSSASKEAANRRAGELVLCMFGAASQALIRNGSVERGIATTTILSDIEKQFSTNISMKVLLESLAARWAHHCAGDSVFM